MQNEFIQLAHRGISLARELRMADAEPLLVAALELNPTEFNIRMNLAIVQMAQNKLDEAFLSYERAIADGYDVLQGKARLGSILAFKGDLDRALTYLTHPTASFVRANLLLAAGHFEEGWRLFERRTDGPPRSDAVPYWRGEDLAGKTIFVWPGRVLGDQLVFGGVLPDLIARAGRVILESKPVLFELFKRSFPTVTVLSQVADMQPLPPPPNADFQVPLNSLGLFFRPSFDSFPKHRGYIKSDPEKVAQARTKYQSLAKGRKIIGLGWRSKNEKFWNRKCAALADWEPLLRLPNIFWVNLLSGDWQSEVDEVRQRLGISVYRDDAITESTDNVFAHAAAMDMVISTSNTVIHAAATQNIPAWLLLPRGLGAFWYWFNDRTDSPFYPSVKIYRQGVNEIGERWWDAAVVRMAADLAKAP